MSQVNHKAVAF